MSRSREEWLAEMTDILGVDPEDVLEVAAMFFDAVDERFASMARAYESGNIGELTRLIHGFKGDAANIGFRQSSAIARTLESQCREGEVVDFEGQLAALEQAVSERKRAIALDSAPGDSHDGSSSAS